MPAVRADKARGQARKNAVRGTVPHGAFSFFQFAADDSAEEADALLTAGALNGRPARRNEAEVALAGVDFNLRARRVEYLDGRGLIRLFQVISCAAPLEI